MPRIGPLIGRPGTEGQLEYIMPIKAPPILRPDALVTVVLGSYTSEHVPVQQIQQQRFFASETYICRDPVGRHKGQEE